MIETVIVNDLEFEVKRSNRRKSIGITVERDGYLVVHAPVSYPINLVEDAIYDKLPWIYGKLKVKDTVFRQPVPKQYITGEGFFYLGKSYRLLIEQSNDSEAYSPPLRFFKSRFILQQNERYRAREHFVQWYKIHAKGWFPDKVKQLAKRVDVKPTGVEIMDLGFRWGSCSDNSTINFHWRTIMLPPEIIEYIIVHELVHLIEPLHNDKFWQIVERVLPDYESKSSWLARNGADYTL